VKKYKTIQLPRELEERIKHLLATHPEVGYVSVKGFVEDSVRRRLEQVEVETGR
jgi:hypothetical protein